MYESFFAFKEKPFSLTPNPRFLFLSKTHNEVYAHLIYGIESRAGFVEVTGEVGTGKTTILRTLLSHLDDKKYRVAFIFNPKLTAFELLRNINREFGVADDGDSNPDLIQALNQFLLDENRAGRTPILVIDEAQNLSGEVLEQIRLLSNLETENDKLIQVILVGQPELRHHLSDHSLRQLNQRIAVRYQLRPLNREETAAYVLHRMNIAGRPDGNVHRMNIAGRPDGNVFSPAALRRVFQCSGGVPRRINLICDRALLTAYSEEQGVVSPRHVKQAVAELAGMGEGSRTPRNVSWSAIAAAALMLVVVAGFFWLMPFGLKQDPHPGLQAVQQPAAPAQAAAPAAAQSVAVASNSLVASCNAVLSLWNGTLLNSEEPAEGFDFDRQFALRGFQLARMAGRLEDFAKFNVPFLLPLPAEHGGGYLAVLDQASDGRWQVAPAYRGRDALDTSELSSIASQVALVPWIDFASIGYVAVPGVHGENVRRLQFLLGLTGCAEVPTNGRYDASSIECVKRFQREHDLTVDGLVGPRTLLLLYQVAGAYNMPRLN